MRKVKLVVHECYAGKRKSEEVFATVFLSNAAAFTEGESFRGDHATPPLGPAKERSFPLEATLLLLLKGKLHHWRYGIGERQRGGTDVPEQRRGPDAE